MTGSKCVLVLGATGGIGGEMARQLHQAGWRVRALTRHAAPLGASAEGIAWVHGDAMIQQDVLNAAKGCTAIVHAVNPPGYRRWSDLVLPMLDNTIAAAAQESATIILPGTVYNYGPDAFPLLTETAPQQPLTRKGAIRVQMESRLERVSRQDARVIIVRAGDFFGPRAGSNWLSQGLVKAGKPVTTIRYPGQRGIGHQWSYLPDVGKTMVELLSRHERLANFSNFHMAGHWDADGTEMCQAICNVVARYSGKTPSIAPFPWWLLPLASPFVETFREMQEMRYLWRTPLRMDNTALLSVLGSEPHTPLNEAVEASLLGMGNIQPGLDR